MKATLLNGRAEVTLLDEVVEITLLDEVVEVTLLDEVVEITLLDVKELLLLVGQVNLYTYTPDGHRVMKAYLSPNLSSKMDIP